MACAMYDWLLVFSQDEEPTSQAVAVAVWLLYRLQWTSHE